jgi:type III restriction enzyme
LFDFLQQSTDNDPLFIIDFETAQTKGRIMAEPQANPFFDHPILNSPYELPTRQWELDENGQPTQRVIESRRVADFITPIPKPRKKRKHSKEEGTLFQDAFAKDISDSTQRYDINSIINNVRKHVGEWRRIENPADWKVTPETARLLNHWRNHQFMAIRPFFCQVEAVETVIWLTEVAPHTAAGKGVLEHLDFVNAEANPGLERLALKLATGAGKTTVMAMLIAWQAVNAVRRKSKRFTNGFLVVAPGITIKDRLRVLQPNDPDNYYADRELVPTEFLPEIRKARIVITNYHAFKLRNTFEVSKVGAGLLRGRGDELNTLENEGQMIRRVMPELMGMKNIMVFNDEAHHCYRERPDADDDTEEIEDAVDKEDAKDEAKRNIEMARLWISGLEALDRNVGVARVMDLSATPFFLRGSGYVEGTLFPWTMSDFSLMDAIECGIVKLPRVPVAENIAHNEMPMFRNLWEHIRGDMPKKGRSKMDTLDPQMLPVRLQTALEALYGHYKATFGLWRESGISVPPCFIIVCNNTSASKLVYDFISGYKRVNASGKEDFHPGRMELFQNYDDHGDPLPRPRTLLIDSEQLESGGKLDASFRSVAEDEIERFKREIVERGGKLAGDMHRGKELDDATILREVMNTVGKKGQLGEGIRCVVSVSMLTEGWDANTVTHILGVRAFGTQLLCEQVIGRALRRQSYDLNAESLFNVEYADVLGIPFDFTARPVVSKPVVPRETVRVMAMRDRSQLEIRFPRVEGYRVDSPDERLTARFGDDSRLVLTPDITGPTITRNSGIIGEAVDLNVKHLDVARRQSIAMRLALHLIRRKFLDEDQNPRLNLYGQIMPIVTHWLENHLDCRGDTNPGVLVYQELAEMACERIMSGINSAMSDTHPIRVILDSYNPNGSSRHVNFTTSRSTWETDSRRCHVNRVVLDSEWEAEYCRVLESHPKVKAYVKNHNLGFEVPYTSGGRTHMYLPDFIVLVDDGRPDPLRLVTEIKGQRDARDQDKARTIREYWIPGVNRLESHGRWAFAELTDVHTLQLGLESKIAEHAVRMLDAAANGTGGRTK